jgi:hypothetical protein
MERHPNTAGLSTGTVPLRDPEDVVICRQVVRMLAHRLDFSTGPGIVDLKLAMTAGWTSAGGLGLGLPGAKRLVHEFRIDSVIGGGTRVVVIRWR